MHEPSNLTNPSMLDLTDLLSRKVFLRPPDIGIYVLLYGDSVVYVGQSCNVGQRIERHRSEGIKVFDGFAFVACESEHMKRLEATYIWHFWPRYNDGLPANEKYRTIEQLKRDHRLPMAVIRYWARLVGAREGPFRSYDADCFAGLKGFLAWLSTCYPSRDPRWSRVSDLKRYLTSFAAPESQHQLITLSPHGSHDARVPGQVQSALPGGCR